MTKLVFASQNPSKIKEIREKVRGINIIGLDPEIFKAELKEDGETLEANAIQKVQQVFEVLGESCFADDTGLEIEALNNEPGVFSARYAGEAKSSVANMKKVLTGLDGVTNRSARFRTVIALIWNEKLHLFEGICEGEISTKPSGEGGFGYDPIFVPKGYNQSFAEMELEEKNKISHRAIAVEKLAAFLSKWA